MKLIEVSLHNFRSIHDENFSLLDYSLLVGGNNAGKSAVVDAIRCFYEKDGYKFNKDRDVCWIAPTDASESWIDLTYQLTKDEWDNLPDYSKLNDNKLKVRKYFLTDKKNTSGDEMKGSVYAFKTDDTINGDPFHGAKTVGKGKFGKLVYIPAVSTVDDHAKLSGPSALRDLLNDVLEDVIAKSSAFTEFEKNFSTFSNSIKTDKGSSGRSIEGLESELNARIKPWGATFHLKINQPNSTTIVKNLIEQEFVDSNHGEPQAVTQYGSGFQRQFIFAIIDVAAQYTSTKVAKKKEFSPEYTLILFEEPEAFLHPPQQESLSHGLQKLAARIDTQVLCSTHSPHFVSKNAHELKGLIKINKIEGVTKIKQIDDETWTKVVETNQVLNDIAKSFPKLKTKLSSDDYLPEMEAIKYFLWLDPERSGLFFANHVLLVEGPTERVLISRLIGDGKLNCVEGDVTIVDTMGKYNTHRFMNLLSAFGIGHSVLVDSDKNADEHKDLNELIRNTKSDLTRSIVFIDGELEDALGVTKLPKAQSHRKPQHIMMLYEKDGIDKTKIVSFSEIINECIKPTKS
ncbi:MAG: AAA family ATPase [Parcubacteria group bacterium]